MPAKPWKQSSGVPHRATGQPTCPGAKPQGAGSRRPAEHPQTCRSSACPLGTWEGPGVHSTGSTEPQRLCLPPPGSGLLAAPAGPGPQPEPRIQRNTSPWLSYGAAHEKPAGVRWLTREWPQPLGTVGNWTEHTCPEKTYNWPSTGFGLWEPVCGP